jgi:hypothetical protein
VVVSWLSDGDVVADARSLPEPSCMYIHWLKQDRIQYNVCISHDRLQVGLTSNAPAERVSMIKEAGKMI